MSPQVPLTFVNASLEEEETYLKKSRQRPEGCCGKTFRPLRGFISLRKDRQWNAHNSQKNNHTAQYTRSTHLLTEEAPQVNTSCERQQNLPENNKKLKTKKTGKKGPQECNHSHARTHAHVCTHSHTRTHSHVYARTHSHVHAYARTSTHRLLKNGSLSLNILLPSPSHPPRKFNKKKVWQCATMQSAQRLTLSQSPRQQ